MAHKAEHGDKTEEDYRTDVDHIVIEEDTVTFIENGVRFIFKLAEADSVSVFLYFVLLILSQMWYYHKVVFRHFILIFDNKLHKASEVVLNGATGHYKD
ncbi:hypothetical protein [Radiobacillus deserti]|uniref:hypothetical protein n=1 Tax=Radiobacillus deserti TaxID=2594883 RepID=UPI00188A4B09|nr:hypothetical protein [Radiobacillus deserti]